VKLSSQWLQVAAWVLRTAHDEDASNSTLGYCCFAFYLPEDSLIVLGWCAKLEMYGTNHP
jgi:hypothetical protein